MQNFPVANLQKHRQAQALKAQAAAGEVKLPRVDPKDAAAIANLPPEQLRLVQVGLYRDPSDISGDDERPVTLPLGWDKSRLAQVQRDFPDSWRAAVRQMGGQA